MAIEVVCRASPSLALIKYWGKRNRRRNLPATPSLAVTLGGLNTETMVSLTEDHDSVFLEGVLQERERYRVFFNRLRKYCRTGFHFKVESRNDFPSSAGLASSSSGFAALTCACARAVGKNLSAGELSDLARTGSASAARSVFEGFVLLRAGARSAKPIFPKDHWPDFRIVVAVTSLSKKLVSSRTAMNRTLRSSPYYRAWVKSSSTLLPEAMDALARRDIEKLGDVVRLSCMRMHAVLLSADPPICYWLPSTIAIIQECQRLREEGIGAWETIDAGPQVKIVCLQPDEERIIQRIHEIDSEIETILSRPGKAPECRIQGIGKNRETAGDEEPTT